MFITKNADFWLGLCHDRDRTYPYTPYPDLSTPIPSHLNHSRAPNAKPEPLTLSHLSNALPNTPTPLRVVNAFPTRPDAPSTFPLPRVKSIPDIHTHSRPNVFQPSLLCVSPIPDVSSVSRLWSGEARSRTSLARCILVCLSSLPIYMFLYVPLSHHSLPFTRFLCLTLSSPSLSTLVSSIFIPYLHWPSLVIPYISYDPFPIVQINPILTTHHTCINTLSTRCCSSVW